MRKVDLAKYEAKRREILKAAGRCFTRDGFHGTTTSAICAEAEISPGHLYHYFESKAEIVTEMVQEHLLETTARYKLMMESSDLVGTLVEEIVRSIRPGGRPYGPLLFDVLANAARDPTMANILRESTHRMQSLLTEWLQRGQDAGQIDRMLDTEAVAAAIISVVDGAQSLAIRCPDLDPKKGSQLLETMLMRLLSPTANAEAVLSATPPT